MLSFERGQVHDIFVLLCPTNRLDECLQKKIRASICALLQVCRPLAYGKRHSPFAVDAFTSLKVSHACRAGKSDRCSKKKKTRDGTIEIKDVSWRSSSVV